MKRWLLLLLLLCAPAAPAQTSLSDINAAIQKAQQLRQQRLEAAKVAAAKIKKLGAAVQQKLSQLRNVSNDINRLEREKRDLEKSIAGLKVQVEDSKKEVAGLNAKLARLKGRMSKLVLKLYRERASRYLPLLGTSSLADLLMRARWVQYLGASDVELVKTLTALVHELQAARQRLEGLVKDLLRKKSEREERIKALEAKRKQYQAILASLKKQKASEEVRVVELNKAAEQLNQQLQSLSQKLAAEKKRLAEERKKREAAARAAGRVTPTFNVPRELLGQLMFPVPGGKITLPFGAKDNTWEVIQADQNYAPVRAAADGQVFATAFYSNYGWNVLILHSDNLLTRYTNLQEPLVNSGETVKQGQIIGYLGGSAIIPPNEMWFSVILSKGKRLVSVDPAKFY